MHVLRLQDATYPVSREHPLHWMKWPTPRLELRYWTALNRTLLVLEGHTIWWKHGRYSPSEVWSDVSYALLKNNILCEPLGSTETLPLPHLTDTQD